MIENAKRPVYSDTTQLNSTSSGVELRPRSVYSDADATQLVVELSTCSQREQLSPISSECPDPVRLSIATQLNSTQRRVELRRRSVYSDPLT